MSEQVLPEHDSRSVDDLINAVLTETDEGIAWDAVRALHWRGTLEVLLRAQELCRSECSQERSLAAKILGQLGIPDRTFPDESAALLLNILRTEKGAEVLESTIMAFGHLDDPRMVSVASRFATHPDPDVRFAVVLTLGGCEDQRAVDLLIRMTSDSSADVRDWATFGLGTLLDLDTPEIRNALIARLEDADEFARGEAMVGLAIRKDPRAIPAILKDLKSGVTDKPLEAAELIGSPELLPALIDLRDQMDGPSSWLEDVIVACTSHRSTIR